MIIALSALTPVLLSQQTFGATFPGNASVTVQDSSGGLSWNTGTRALTVSCWFKISIPSGTNLTENMTILVNRQDGDENSPYAFLIRFNITEGNIEFVSRGSAETYVKPLIKRPYLERWYHVAVKRANTSVTGLVDGRDVFQEAVTVGDGVLTSQGISIGGWNNSKYFYGDIQEVAIYQEAVGSSSIRDRMFIDLPTDSLPTLKGYFKLGVSTNSADLYRNFAQNPPAGTEQGSKQGPVAFEETNQAGEQSIFDSTKNKGENLIAPLSGTFSWSQVALSRPTPGIAFDLRFGYSSGIAFSGGKLGEFDPFEDPVLGPGWRHTFEARIIPDQNSSERRIVNWDGSVETWYKTNNLFKTRHKEYRGELTKKTAENGDEFFEWVTPERLIYHFLDPTTGPEVMQGQLYEIRDFNGNVVRVFRDPNKNGVVTQVVDSVFGKYDFRYNPQRRLTNVTFGSWAVNFAYDSTNRLVSKSIANDSAIYANVNTSWQFGYNPTNNLLDRIIDPKGNTNVLVQYDQYGRKTNLVDSIARATRTEYGVPSKRQIRNTDPGGFAWLETYDRKGHILSQQDPLTNITSYTYDANGNRTSITEPLGWKTFFAYDARANVIARTNALAEVTTWVFHTNFNKAIQQITQQPRDGKGWTTWTNFYDIDNATGNLLQHRDALGPLVSYTYFTNGLVLTSTDANNHTTTLGYDTNGFLIARTDPATNTTTYTVNEVGWKLVETNPLGDPTSYTYDLNGNPVRIEDVLGRIFNRTYDPNGNLLSTTDGKGNVTSNAYDAANQKIGMTDRTGTNRWAYFYTSRGKLDHVTDPLGNSVSNTYDAANRLVRVTDPLGQSVTNQYDPNGNLSAFLDKTGQRWTKTFDRLNRVTAEIDPLGNARATTYDIADRIQQITSPNGYPSTHSYDGRGRLTKWIDPQGFNWLYAYDGVGNILDIEDALHGHYIMEYGSRNERVLEQNQDTNIWRYVYDELLRLKEQTDPNGTTRTPTYDAAGRALFVDFSTGRRDSFNYDANDNRQTVARRFSGVTTVTRFVYDPLDRVIEQNDALSQTVLYGYDPLGRVTSITYPGNKRLNNSFDALGRLTNLLDWASRQMNYTYDAADRLISRIYPNGVTQSNSFDTAGRITGLNHSTLNSQLSTNNQIAIALSYAYDRNGNKTGSSEKGTFGWPLPSLTDERADYTAAGRLKTRIITRGATNAIPSPGGEGQGEGGSSIIYKYDPSGNMTNASGAGQTWRLTYDEDNRTTSIDWDCGLTSKHILNRYDALGRRISKTVDGATTGYVLSLNGGMERILCDLGNSGNVTAWYIHGLDLCYKIDSTNGLTCYHADAMANIIALTDGATNLVAQYAFTPYGRSLGSTNFQSRISNPYSFVGLQGVMEEIPGLYFMRARYYSAEAGIFLSSDPVKTIGPGWRPLLYTYADDNSLSFIDPKGEYFFWEEWHGLYGGSGLTGGRHVTYPTLADWKQAKADGLLPKPQDEDDELFYRHDLSYVVARTHNNPEMETLADESLGVGLLKLAAKNSWEYRNQRTQFLKGGRTEPPDDSLGAKIRKEETAGHYFLSGANAVFHDSKKSPQENVSGTTGKSVGQMAGGAIAANNHANALNQIQPTQQAPPGGSSQTGGGSNTSGGSNRTSNQKPSTNPNPPQPPPTAPSTSIWTTLVKAVSSWLSGFHWP